MHTDRPREGVNKEFQLEDSKRRHTKILQWCVLNETQTRTQLCIGWIIVLSNIVQTHHIHTLQILITRKIWRHTADMLYTYITDTHCKQNMDTYCRHIIHIHYRNSLQAKYGCILQTHHMHTLQIVMASKYGHILPTHHMNTLQILMASKIWTHTANTSYAYITDTHCKQNMDT